VKIQSDVARNSAASLLIAGAGDVGMRLARLRAVRGDEVIAVRRRESEAGAALRTIQADLATGADFERLPGQVDAVVFCAAPDQRSEESYRALYLDGLRRLLDRVSARRAIFVSSTAVFAQDAGEWLVEDSPAEPDAWNGRILLAVERELSRHDQGIALRLSGIYGPGREAMLRRARRGESGRSHWTNRIHVDDAAAALSHLLDLPEPESVYLGSDDHPALESDLFAWIRERENLPAVAEADGPVSGRRISNRLLRASGWTPAHPDYRSGYLRLLADAGV
jgi:electron-transferring-flavoprotein dehydrogenase